jgi:hypothetical protein
VLQDLSHYKWLQRLGAVAGRQDRRRPHSPALQLSAWTRTESNRAMAVASQLVQGAPCFLLFSPSCTAVGEVGGGGGCFPGHHTATRWVVGTVVGAGRGSRRPTGLGPARRLLALRLAPFQWASPPVFRVSGCVGICTWSRRIIHPTCVATANAPQPCKNDQKSAAFPSDTFADATLELLSPAHHASFLLRTIHLSRSLPPSREECTIGHWLLRAIHRHRGGEGVPFGSCFSTAYLPRAHP